MSDESQRPIVIKRIKKGEHGAHGGVWKLAYADFMTAMMAFFLLMWLLGNTAKSDLQAVGSSFFDGGAMALSLAPEAGLSMVAQEAVSGGPDLTKNVGVNKECFAQDPLGAKERALAQQQSGPAGQIEAQKLAAVKGRISAAIDQSEFLRQYANQLRLDITAEGLRIQIVDEQNRPMFASGSANLLPHAKEILRQIGLALNDINNSVSVSGHTDAMPYSMTNKTYTNWELSADRANSARRELVAGGMNDSRVLRVVGLASAVPYDPENPFSPVNRRISIVVLNRMTEDAISASAEKMPEPSAPEQESTPATNQQTRPAPAQQVPALPTAPPRTPAEAPSGTVPQRP